MAGATSPWVVVVAEVPAEHSSVRDVTGKDAAQIAATINSVIWLELAFD